MSERDAEIVRRFEAGEDPGDPVEEQYLFTALRRELANRETQIAKLENRLERIGDAVRRNESHENE